MIMGALLPLLFGCNKERNEEPIPEPDTRVLSFTLEVANEDYTQHTVLDGIGDTQIAGIESLPEWVTSITRQEDLYEGNLVLDVTVTADGKLNWNRSADIVLRMESGATVNLTVNQRPGLPDFAGTFGATTPSVNTDFEEDWASQTEIEVVSSVVRINDKVEVRSKNVFLPWAFNEVGVQQHLPDDELRKMMLYQDHWALAFNTTGIETAAGANLNYFGLFNRYTHTLRVFYYWPEELIPASGANDHAWHVKFTGKPAEYNPTAFAVPYNHRFEGTDATRFQSYANLFFTSPLTDEIGLRNPGIVVPAPGWWAFDMDMSAMRVQSFFDDYDEFSKITIGLDLFDVQSVFMKSLMDGVSIGGDLTGSMNLQGLVPQSASTGGTIAVSLLGSASNFATNTYLLQMVNEKTAFNPWFILPAAIGVAAGIAGNITDGLINAPPDDAEAIMKKLGELNASLNLKMSGVISTEGTIESQRSHSVPSLSLPIGYLSKIRGNKKFQMGKGIWNIENDPVVYVVRDAFWANKPVLTYYSRSQQSWYRQGNEVAEYDISSSPSQLGLRIISFFDPSSLGNVILNEDVFGDISEVKVAASYGVYPGASAGITDLFRSAVGLDYESMSLATSNKDGRASTGNVAGTVQLPFKIFKDRYTNDFFQFPLAEEDEETFGDLIGTRLSAQGVNGAYERRYYGSSVFYMNPDASSSVTDIVQYVSDPQIFVPFNEQNRTITDPDIPDLVVTIQLRVKSTSPGQSEPTTKLYRLRYVPRIEYVNAADVPALYESIAAKANGGMASGVDYQTFEFHKNLIKAYSDEISYQLSK